MAKTSLANHEVVTLAVYLLGGDRAHIDTEDVAIKANELAPGRFVWKKYPDQVSLEHVRVYLSDAKKPAKGEYLLGSGTDGWMLTDVGLHFARSVATSAQETDLSREPISTKERQKRRAERAHIVSSEAFAKFQIEGADGPSEEEVEAMFRLTPYVLGKARDSKITRIVNTYGADEQIGEAVRELAARLRRGNG